MSTKKKSKASTAHEFFSSVGEWPTSVLASCEPPAGPTERSKKVAERVLGSLRDDARVSRLAARFDQLEQLSRDDKSKNG